MKEKIDIYAYKEAWYVLKKLPLNLISKIPFDVRNNIAEKAQSCATELEPIDTTVALKEMNISDDAKDILSYLYINYFSDESIRAKIKEYINICDNNG